MTINQLWTLLDANTTVHWSNDSYKITVESIIPDNQYQLNHFTRRGDKVLRVTCTSNYFGSLLNESDLESLYVK